MREVHDVEQALVHAHADEEVIVDRVVRVAPGGRVVELHEAAVQPLDGGVRAVDVRPQLGDRRQEARVGPPARRHVGERALHRADKVAREAERTVELVARDGSARGVEDVVEERAEVLVGEVGHVDACTAGQGVSVRPVADAAHLESAPVPSKYSYRSSSEMQTGMLRYAAMRASDSKRVGPTLSLVA